MFNYMLWSKISVAEADNKGNISTGKMSKRVASF